MVSNCESILDLLPSSWWLWRDLGHLEELHLLWRAHFLGLTLQGGLDLWALGPHPRNKISATNSSGLHAESIKSKWSFTHLFGESPPTGTPKPSRYSPLGLQHVPPRPQVQGRGLAGMMLTSPPTPPSWDLHHATGHCRASRFSFFSRYYSFTDISEDHSRAFTCWRTHQDTKNTKHSSGTTLATRPGQLWQPESEWSGPPQDHQNFKLDPAQGHRRMRSPHCAIKQIALPGQWELLASKIGYWKGSQSIWLPWVKSTKWSLLASFYPKFEVVDLTWIALPSTKPFKMDILWRKETPSITLPNCLLTKGRDEGPLLNRTQVPNKRLLNYELKLMLWWLPQTKLKAKTHQGRRYQVHPTQLGDNHLLKQPSKDNDPGLLIQPNYW